MDKLLDSTRDFDAAKAAFEAYLDEYDRADDKIHLKNRTYLWSGRCCGGHCPPYGAG